MKGSKGTEQICDATQLTTNFHTYHSNCQSNCCKNENKKKIFIFLLTIAKYINIKNEDNEKSQELVKNTKKEKNLVRK